MPDFGIKMNFRVEILAHPLIFTNTIGTASLVQKLCLCMYLRGVCNTWYLHVFTSRDLFIVRLSGYRTGSIYHNAS